ncbi:P2X purinoceptor 4 isoform X2 [Lingula anatina]|uniref:P2X purinoceptor 4 isoform X1 n=1 Tax=Lingula anatina TaxID=7574 RepID=A0A1S3IC41_LINAN|nr:P2X purinoceptor 4 isoform X1 [Lingula anatina]XP_013395826.1 P2X purinoceptor 4 isoform X2 [Lingula anatina]|eukprot:XP_013395825.1 P2X purinoceptor 4 isoform X1 [Lingula anatina]
MCLTLDDVKIAARGLFEYETPKYVVIKNNVVGTINFTIQLTILLYTAFYALWWERGYQETEVPVSAVTTKLKGIEYTNISSVGPRIWDVAEYVVPPLEKDAFFLMTNMVVTPNQKLGKCDEDPEVAPCKRDSDCSAGQTTFGSNGRAVSGVMTGRCIPSSRNSSMTSCEVFAWCPVENDVPLLKGRPVLPGVENCTVLIKNYIVFPKFGVRRRTIPEDYAEKHLKTCRWNKDEEKYCPTFRIGDIINSIGENFTELAYKGGVININIQWDCNLDYDPKYCLPLFTMRRVDEKTDIAPGLNFRHAYHYVEHGQPARTLIKAWGIRFVITVSGKGGKFSIAPTLRNIGAGLALMAMASVVCDIVLRIWYRSSFEKEKYNEAKIMRLECC